MMSRVSCRRWSFRPGIGMSWAMRASRPWFQGSRLALRGDDLCRGTSFRPGSPLMKASKCLPGRGLVGQGDALAVDQDDLGRWLPGT